MKQKRNKSLYLKKEFPKTGMVEKTLNGSFNDAISAYNMFQAV